MVGRMMAKMVRSQQGMRQGRQQGSPRSEAGARALALSREFLHRFWAQDSAWIRGVLDDDVMWIGAQRGMYDVGADMFMDSYEELCTRMPHVRIAEEEISLVLSGPTACVCAGRYAGAVHADDRWVCGERQRITCVWRVVRPDADEAHAGLALAHLHISSPLQDDGLGGLLPAPVGEGPCLRADAAAGPEPERGRVVALDDAEGATHWIRSDAVLSAESHGRQTVLHTSGGDIVISSYLTQVVERLDGIVERVHRCYAVNPVHVKSLHGTELTLDDGTRIPVPVRRVAEVRELLGIGA